jgi:hypothetical protein
MSKSTTKTLKDLESKDMFTANIEKSERMLSIGTGFFITLSGIARLFSNPLLAITEIGAGALLLDRGISGYCLVKDLTENKQEETFASSHQAPLSTAETAIGSTVTDAIDLGTGTSRV